MFYSFRPALHRLSPGQSQQGRDVRNHNQRLVKGADQILALRKVDRGLAAYGRVHHGGYAGGHLDETHTAGVGGGHEASQVADHAAPEGNDDVAALRSTPRQPVVDFTGCIQGLAGLAGSKGVQVRFDPGKPQGCLDGLAVETGHRVV